MDEIDKTQLNQPTAEPKSENIQDNSALITSMQNEQIEDNNSSAKSGILGKFKDSNELLSAYSNLEKEFTKRSQRMKSLETEIEKTKFNQENIAAELIKRMATLNPELADIISLAENTEVPGSCENSSLETKLAIALKGKILPKDQEARHSYVDKIIDEDSSLKEKILSKALDKLPSLSSPKLNKYRGQTIITPPNRPQNLAEAGRLAENIFNNRSK